MKNLHRYSAMAAVVALFAAASHAQDTGRTTQSGQDSHAASHGDQPAQRGSRFRASKLIGAQVHNASGEEVGAIQDLLVSSDNEVVAAILSIGGVLGIGDRLIEVPYEELRISTDGDIYVPMTAAQLAAERQFTADPEALATAALETETTRPTAREPDVETQAEANVEAQQESFAGEDPRVAEGLAENKQAYEDDESSHTSSEPEEPEEQNR